LETTGLSPQESMDILATADVKFIAVRGETGGKVCRKLQAAFKRNPGYSTFVAVCKILDGEEPS
jgi:hypothetical protein